ncbi:unnamed protein product [Danaus chrysippus]|uniref:(African queen) hypothetical protein n=1 Tax=Danaus chrysippus TaxID=151541 RepID=A0A8J2QW41_9NEOP|nr:unnamed protein product [Danaus chrysippus]
MVIQLLLCVPMDEIFEEKPTCEKSFVADTTDVNEKVSKKCQIRGNSRRNSIRNKIFGCNVDQRVETKTSSKHLYEKFEELDTKQNDIESEEIRQATDRSIQPGDGPQINKSEHMKPIFCKRYFWGETDM